MNPSAPVTRQVLAAEELAEVSPQVSDGIVRPGGVVLVCFHAAVPADEQPKGSPERGRSAVRSGAFTGLSYVIVEPRGRSGRCLSRAQVRPEPGDRRLHGRLRRLPRARARGPGLPDGRRPDLTRAEAEGRLGSEFSGLRARLPCGGDPATVLAAALLAFLGRVDHRAASGRVGRGCRRRAAMARAGGVRPVDRRACRQCARCEGQLRACRSRLRARGHRRRRLLRAGRGLARPRLASRGGWRSTARSRSALPMIVLLVRGNRLRPASRRSASAWLSALAASLRRSCAHCAAGPVSDRPPLRRRHGRGQRHEPVVCVSARGDVHRAPRRSRSR